MEWVEVGKYHELSWCLDPAGFSRIMGVSLPMRIVKP